MNKNPFSGKIVYFSGPIRGVAEPETDIAWRLVRFLLECGAEVLNEHVAGRTLEEIREIRAKKLGDRAKEVMNSPSPWFYVREEDIAGVDAATHVVALVSGPSHGVGMEIQRALDKTRMGLNPTPVLCLVHTSCLDKLTWMIKGVGDVGFVLRTYEDAEDAICEMYDFLTK